MCVCVFRFWREHVKEEMVKSVVWRRRRKIVETPVKRKILSLSSQSPMEATQVLQRFPLLSL